MSTPTPASSGAGTAQTSRPVVIFNPASGSGADEDDLRAAFEGHDVEFTPTTEDDPGTGQARAPSRPARPV